MEERLYGLSSRLDVEIYILGVGKSLFVPEQRSGAAHVETRDTGIARWIMACADQPEEWPWWYHTHPGMGAFFSITDVGGAHILYEAIGRSLYARVLGKGKAYDVMIDEPWLAKNPKPAPVVISTRPVTRVYSSGSVATQDIECRIAIRAIFTEFGEDLVLDCLNQILDERKEDERHGFFSDPDMPPSGVWDPRDEESDGQATLLPHYAEFYRRMAEENGEDGSLVERVVRRVRNKGRKNKK